ncbi:Ninja-family protein [Rhynchospora pubera]|uniref:Ninja-family protein n=1 Tax=Rhynchospora pubera TaxID=906938 RepID=A0AAV8CJ13_9POAL|nr:Ninja-family protein [Rhynchospora pubera]KAJ4762933.1 Ninja-family protein [Rhynchospora pubera]
MDFLGRFGGVCENDSDNGFGKSRSKSIDTDEIELSLGLSTNGCFGVDPKGKSKLVRSSSIASILPLPKTEIEELAIPVVPIGTLVRTASLPVETEEAVRKRKELQCLKRLEVKRKRLERRNSLKSGVSSKDKSDSVDFGIINRCRNGTNGVGVVNEFSSFGIKAASLGSQGSSCSVAISEIEGKFVQGTDSKTNAQTPINSTSSAPNPNTIGRTSSMVDEMPCVSTMGENGRTIEGFLYNFRKGGAEVRIVCVCHGSFLTPAEFVKHAGGGDVTNPLKHIKVNSTGFL